ncbi:MAG: hypothetical protein V3V62_07395 [bacterium]
MPESRQVTFICPACGLNELPLPEGRDPQEIPYVELAELDNCDHAKSGAYIYGNGFTRGFGGLIREEDGEGGVRERWVPPRAVVAYHYYRDQSYITQAEPTRICYPHPLYRNRSVTDGIENIYVAMAFLPHGEVLNPEMRERGELLAKSLG